MRFVVLLLLFILLSFTSFTVNTFPLFNVSNSSVDITSALDMAADGIT